MYTVCGDSNPHVFSTYKPGLLDSNSTQILLTLTAAGCDGWPKLACLIENAVITTYSWLTLSKFFHFVQFGQLCVEWFGIQIKSKHSH